MKSPVPKQFLNLGGKPILRLTLEALAGSGIVTDLVLVVPPGELEAVRREWEKSSLVSRVVAGGEKRQDSVYNGFRSLSPGTEIVIVHDGVRPFITGEMIHASVEAAVNTGAAIVATPVSDTVKRVNGQGIIEQTVEREGLWRVQTPQVFRYDILKRAFEKAYSESFYGTDEGSLVERLGEKVQIVPGSEFNIKITRREDLFLGESILRFYQGS